MSEPTDKKTVQQSLEEEMGKLKTRMDEMKVRMHLASKDAQDAMQPHLDELETKLRKAEKDWDKFEDASGNAWQEIKKGLSLSFKAMKRSIAKADEHFEEDEKKK